MSELSDFIRNAIVPPDAKVLPVDKYVGITTKVLNSDYDFSNQGLTSYSQPSGASALFNAVATGMFGLYSDEFDFSGNALPTANVDALLSAFQYAVFQSQGAGAGTAAWLVIDLSGGTNGVPTPSATHVDAIYTMQFANGAACSGQFNISAGAGTNTWVFDPLTNFADSSGTNIGVMDDPAGSDIATYVASHQGGLGIVIAGDTLTITNTHEDNYGGQPDTLYNVSLSIGVTANQTQIGVAFAENVDKAYLISKGATVTTN